LPPSRGFDAIMVVMDRFSKITFHSHKGWSHSPRDGKVILHTCFQASWSSKGHSLESRPKVHKQVLASALEENGVKVEDEHFLSPSNRWTNWEGQLGDPTILKELCGDRSTRLGGPFGVGQILLQQLGTFRN
jgi:hypothetical protein